MYFLENYDAIISYYNKVTNTSKTNRSTKAISFYEKMSLLKSLLEDCSTKNPLSRKDADQIAYYYNDLLNSYKKDTHGQKRIDSTIEHEMLCELETITCMDTNTKKNLNDLLEDASDNSENFRPEVGNIHHRYMEDCLSDPANTHPKRRDDLRKDQTILEALGTDLMNAKKHVHGSSPQFNKMEAAYIETKNLVDQMINEKKTDDVTLRRYRDHLDTLSRLAEEYRTYKTDHDKKKTSQLKKKEQKRVAFSENLRNFADVRRRRLYFNESRRTLLDNMKMKSSVYTAYYQDTLEKNILTNAYETKMVKVSEDMHSFERFYVDQKLSAKKIFGTAGNVDAVEDVDCTHTFRKILKGAFGDLALNEPRIQDYTDTFLKTGKLTKEFSNCCVNAASTAEKHNKEAYNEASDKAMKKLIRILSSMKKVNGNYLFIADMIDILAEEKRPENVHMHHDVMQTLKGIKAASKIVSDGMNSWDRLHTQEDGNTADAEEDLLNFVTMKTLEAEMKEFNERKKNAEAENSGRVIGPVNPVFAWLGSQEGNIQLLKDHIRDTKAFRSLLKHPFKDISYLVKNTNEKVEAKYNQLMHGVFAETFAEFGKHQEEKGAEPVIHQIG